MPIIDYQKKADRLEKKLFSSTEISDKNKQLLKRFLVTYDVTPARLSIFLDKIRAFLASTPDIEASIQDKNFINNLCYEWRKRYSPASYNTFVCIAKVFARWLNDGDSPKGFKDVRPTAKTKMRRSLSPEDMITWEEGLSIANQTNSHQFRTIVLLQLDAGFRPSEFIDLDYGDVSVCEGVPVIRVRNGKTGSRNVVIYRAAEQLMKWLEEHPTKEQGDPLWITEYPNQCRLKGEKASKIRRYSYAAIKKRVKKMAIVAGINKPMDFYNFRHSSAVLDKKDGLDVEIASARRGHSVAFHTKIYGRMSTEDEVLRFKSHYGENSQVKASKPAKTRSKLDEREQRLRYMEAQMKLQQEAMNAQLKQMQEQMKLFAVQEIKAAIRQNA